MVQKKPELYGKEEQRDYIRENIKRGGRLILFTGKRIGSSGELPAKAYDTFTFDSFGTGNGLNLIHDETQTTVFVWGNLKYMDFYDPRTEDDLYLESLLNN